MKAARIPPQSEKQFQQVILDLARALGWLASHTYDSRRSEPGFPDAVLVHPRQARVIFAEFKSDTGLLTKAQERWIRALLAAGAETYVWLPRDKEKIVSLLAHSADRTQAASVPSNTEPRP